MRTRPAVSRRCAAADRELTAEVAAARDFESQVFQFFEADATLESPAVAAHPLRESPALPLVTLRVTDNVELRARIPRMRPSLIFSISLIIAANLHIAIAQSSPTPAPTPVTLTNMRACYRA